ncbi:hypothetical protein JW962_01380 [Candidatus Dojkabacteria bacterium]|nr:hypothetical protein [Candidatus Dojkabacteria bacterium]
MSAFNVLWWDNKPWIIDFPQGVNVKTNGRAKEILYKDLNSLYKYFDRFCRLDKDFYETELAEFIRFILW